MKSIELVFSKDLYGHLVAYPWNKYLMGAENEEYRAGILKESLVPTILTFRAGVFKGQLTAILLPMIAIFIYWELRGLSTEILSDT